MNISLDINIHLYLIVRFFNNLSYHYFFNFNHINLAYSFNRI